MSISLRLLDLFCGSGGASRGYSFFFDDIVGVDHRKMKKYPYRFIQADATTYPLDGFDLVHASPPCLDHSVTKYLFNEPDGSGWMLEHTIERCIYQGVSYVVENVMNASLPGRPHQFTLCGASLGPWLRNDVQFYLPKHRKFWCNFPVNAPDCMCARAKANGLMPATLMNDGNLPNYLYQRKLHEIDWMNLKEMKVAIPPYMTRFIAREFMRYKGLID
jgi:DNA (cytosine-5)-methyltransferase 1